MLLEKIAVSTGHDFPYEYSSIRGHAVQDPGQAVLVKDVNSAPISAKPQGGYRLLA